jgi:hypothetical protein
MCLFNFQLGLFFWGSLKIITKNRTTQDFHVVSSYVTLFKGKISNLEIGNFALNGVMELLGLTGIS